MTSYQEILRVKLEHAYYGASDWPVQAHPTDPQQFHRDGLRLQQRGRTVSVIGVEGADGLPEYISLTIVAEDPDILQVTDWAIWKHLPVLCAPLGQDVIDFTTPTAEEKVSVDSRWALCRLSAARSAAGCRQLTVRFHTIKALWAYHVVGGDTQKEIAIVDLDRAVTFAPADPVILPKGERARVLRSTTPIEAQARSKHRFSLQEFGPFGPRTLVPLLPAAGISFKPNPDEHAEYPLQADIYVNLW